MQQSSMRHFRHAPEKCNLFFALDRFHDPFAAWHIKTRPSSMRNLCWSEKRLLVTYLTSRFRRLGPPSPPSRTKNSLVIAKSRTNPLVVFWALQAR